MYLYNAQIITLDKKIPDASALAIRDGRIIALGSDTEICSEFERQMPGHNLLGQTVLPGLTDAHIHLEHYALGLQKVDCETSTKTECLERVAARSRETPAGEWVLGHGWNQNNWEDGYGTASELDEVSPNNPVYLSAKSLHAAWTNTIALRQANLTRDSIDPAGGKLGRDESGQPERNSF